MVSAVVNDANDGSGSGSDKLPVEKFHQTNSESYRCRKDPTYIVHHLSLFMSELGPKFESTESTNYLKKMNPNSF